MQIYTKLTKTLYRERRICKMSILSKLFNKLSHKPQPTVALTESTQSVAANRENITQAQIAPRKNSKCYLIYNHLVEKGSITTWEAIQLYHATRLSAYIYQLRNKGMHIVSLTQDGGFVKYVYIKE